MWAYRQGGWLLLAIGVIHCLIGIALTWDILSAWHQDGWWHSIEGRGAMQMDRFALLWFQVTGLSWVLLGWLTQLWLDRVGRLPAQLGWTLALMAALVAYVLPVSGAWAMLVLGLVLALAPRFAADGA